MFIELLGDTMEVYVDDMLVNSFIAEQHLDHLQLAFEVLRNYNMKLNSAKCSFDISFGKFLDYMVIQRSRSNTCGAKYPFTHIYQGRPMSYRKDSRAEPIHLQVCREVSFILRHPKKIQV